MTYRLLVNPLAKGAYFDAYLDVGRAELEAHFPNRDMEVVSVGGLDFFRLSLHDDELSAAARCSVVQGIFREEPSGALWPCDIHPDLRLPEALVYGAKYRGKTHELVTQLALNLALLHHRGERPPTTVLDPLAGRGTTLLWGLRYHLNGRGLEIDPHARDALHAHLKKQCKLHRISHSAERGTIGGRGRSKEGSFTHFSLGGQNLRLVTGDAAEARRLLSQQRFDLLVSDLPYGIEFKSRNDPSLLGLVQRCLPSWSESLRPGAAMVLVFNRYQPRRPELEALLHREGYEVAHFAAPHRMSESIQRDLMVATRPTDP